MGHAWIVAAIALAVWPLPVALGQHPVQIRARSVIRPTAPYSSEPTRVRGTLVDEVGGALANEIVTVRATPVGTAARGRTDPSGHFDLPAPDPGAAAKVRFEGNAHVDATEWLLDQPAPRTVADIVEPTDGTVDLDRTSFDLSIRLQAPIAGDIIVVDERGEELARGHLADETSQRFSVATSKLGPPGIGTLSVATVNVDGEASAPIGSLALTRFRTTTVDASIGRVNSRDVVQGAVRDREGLGLADQTVTLFDDAARPAATASTDETGSFVVRIPADGRIGPGAAVVVRHESHAPWLKGGQSSPLTVPPLAPAYPPAWWLLVLLGVAIAAAVALGRPVVPAVGPSVGGRAREKLASASRLTSGLRHQIVARVVDATNQVAVRGARILARAADATPLAQALADDEGGFELSALPKGTVLLDVIADGYEPRSVSAEIPHDGRWYGATISLSSLRDAALRQYERAFDRAGPGMRTTQVTPRERLALHAPNTSDPVHARLTELTLAFERAYYARVPPTTEDITRIGSLADSVGSPPNRGGDSFDGPSDGFL